MPRRLTQEPVEVPETNAAADRRFTQEAVEVSEHTLTTDVDRRFTQIVTEVHEHTLLSDVDRRFTQIVVEVPYQVSGAFPFYRYGVDLAGVAMLRGRQ